MHRWPYGPGSFSSGKVEAQCRSVAEYMKAIVPKKVELLIRFFEPFWILRVFHFFLRTFGEVAGLPEPLVASDETYTQSKFDISGSNETMQNALAPLV